MWKILDNLKVHTFAFRIAAEVADFTDFTVVCAEVSASGVWCVWVNELINSRGKGFLSAFGIDAARLAV